MLATQCSAALAQTGSAHDAARRVTRGHVRKAKEQENIWEAVGSYSERKRHVCHENDAKTSKTLRTTKERS